MDGALANADARQQLQIAPLTHLQTIFGRVIKRKNDIMSTPTLFLLQHVMFHVLSKNCVQGL